MALTKDQEERYQRNILLPEISIKGQESLLKSKILIVGAGGLGSAAILYIAAAGVGNIAIVDNDIVEISNLQRQIIHNFKDIKKNKVTSAKEKVELLNKDINITTYNLRIDQSNFGALINDYDFILDCSDNFYTRFTINKVCFDKKKTLISAAVKGFFGQISVFKPFLANNPCYACFNPNILKKDTSLPLSQKGILGSVAGMFGSIQATMTIKEILQIGESMVGKVLIADLLKNDFRKVVLKKNMSCQICGSATLV